MGNHLYQGAFHAHRVENKNSQGHKTHVGDGRIGNELFHVRLHQCNQAYVYHGDQRQRDDIGRHDVAGVRYYRQAESQKPIGAELEGDGREYD